MRYTVQVKTEDKPEYESVDAYRIEIYDNGTLILWDGHCEVIRAYAPGVWIRVWQA